MLKKNIPQSFKSLLRRSYTLLVRDQWKTMSWSQEGEDRILCRLFSEQDSGFYVDVGAHHPKRFSNTYLFYNLGWRGINIDAMPGSMDVFNISRKRDINLELGINHEEDILNYYIFNEPALNGFSRELSMDRDEAKSTYHIKEVIKVKVFPLSKILDHYLPSGQKIDFLTVDAEGFDFEVLKSNDWYKYRPKYVLAEILGSNLKDIERSLVGKLMNDVGYQPQYKCVNTVFFEDVNQK